MAGPPRKKHISAVVHANRQGLGDAKAKTTVIDNCFPQFPNEIVLQIIHSTEDKTSILILRQTCRRFKRLCEDTTLEYLLPSLLSQAYLTASFLEHGISPVKNELRHHAPQRYGYLLANGLKNDDLFGYCQLLWRDGMCNDCAELRRDPSAYGRAIHDIYQTMRCSACKCNHPAFLFSHRERQKRASQRICIGRQGHVPLCEHRSVMYGDLERRSISAGGHKHVSIRDCRSCQLDGIHSSIGIQLPERGSHFSWISVNKNCYNTMEDLADHAAEPKEYIQPHCTCIHDTNLLPKALKDSNWTEDACHMPGCTFTARRVPDGDPRGGLIVHHQRITITSPTEITWLMALDPESYLSQDDNLTRGLMWCRNPTCAITKKGRAVCAIFHQYDLPHPKIRLSSQRDENGLEFDELARRPGLRKRDQHGRVTY